MQQQQLKSHDYNPTLGVDSKNRIVWCSPIGQRPHIDGVELFITGHPAHLLYLAVTGHPMNRHPNTCIVIQAHRARAELMALAGEGEDYALAYAVLRQWGAYLRPWLGVQLIDKAGQVITGAPEYAKIIDLNTGLPAQIAKTYEVMMV